VTKIEAAKLIAEVDRLTRERDGWQEEARRYAENATFWRDQHQTSERAPNEARVEVLSEALRCGLATHAGKMWGAEECDCGDCTNARAALALPEEEAAGCDPDCVHCASWRERQPDPSCWRCGHGENPGSLMLSGKGNMLIPCPYCHPGKAVEWMADHAHGPDNSNTFAGGHDEPDGAHFDEPPATCEHVCACGHGESDHPGSTDGCRKCGCDDFTSGAVAPATAKACGECRSCNGTGKRPIYSAGEEMVAGFEPCKKCNGTGRAGEGDK